jgi:hypothetical protein
MQDQPAEEKQQPAAEQRTSAQTADLRLKEELLQEKQQPAEEAKEIPPVKKEQGPDFPVSESDTEGPGLQRSHDGGDGEAAGSCALRFP